jgi:hypothetical protein
MKTISVYDARNKSIDLASYELSQLNLEAETPLLELEYFEADECWMFFRSKEIELPPEQALSDCAYCVSKSGTVRSVPNYFADPIRAREFLETMSKHFKDRGL